MSIFRSSRRQRRTVAETVATTFVPPAQPWPVVHADTCRCTYCA